MKSIHADLAAAFPEATQIDINVASYGMRTNITYENGFPKEEVRQREIGPEIKELHTIPFAGALVPQATKRSYRKR